MNKRQRIYEKFGGKCYYTGKDLPPDWQVDHAISKQYHRYYHQNDNPDREENLVPCLKIINHYKRDKSIEEFRKYIGTLHIRLKKLPKKTTVPRTEGRIKYLNEVASHFGITVDKPFSGKFYFETL